MINSMVVKEGVIVGYVYGDFHFQVISKEQAVQQVE